MGCGASSAVQAADIPTPLPSFEGKAAPSVGTGASPASTPPSSAESDGEEAGALPLPPGATAADPGEPVVTTSWTDDGAARYRPSHPGSQQPRLRWAATPPRPLRHPQKLRLCPDPFALRASFHGDSAQN